MNANLAVTIWKTVAKYPAVSAGLANVLIVLGSYVGLNLTTGQLTTLATAIAAIFGVLVHIGVIPVTNVDGVKAGFKATPGTLVLVPESEPKPVADAAYTPTLPNVTAVPEARTEPPRDIVEAAIVPLEGGKLPKPVTPSMRKE